MFASTALAWRFFDLSRDPAAFSWSAGELIDPGTYLYNARSFGRTGAWRFTEDDLGIQLAPGFALLSGAWLRLFGATYAHGALLEVLLGFLAIAFAAGAAEIAGRLWFHPLPRGWTGAICVWFLAISYVFFGLQQVPNGDMAAMALSGAAAFLLMALDLPNLRHRARTIGYFAGLALGLAPFMKLHAGMSTIGALIAWGLAYWIQDENWKPVWKRATAPLLVGLATTGALWIPWMTLMHRTVGLRSPLGEIQDVFAGARNLGVVFTTNLAYRQPLEFGLALLAVSRYMEGVWRRWSLLFVTTCFCTGCTFICFLSYSPLRYRMIFTMPVVIFASHLAASLCAGKPYLPQTRMSIGLQAAAAAVFALTLIQTTLVRFEMRQPRWIISLCAAVGVAAALASIKWISPRLYGPLWGALLLAGTLATAAPQWIRGELHRGHYWRDLGARIEAQDPAAILAGDIGAEVALWTNLEIYLTPDLSAPCRITTFVMRTPDLLALPPSVRSALELKMRMTHPDFAEPILVFNLNENKMSGCQAVN